MCSVWVKRASALVIGVMAMLTAGSIYSYNIYATSLQLTFNFTQEEIDTIASFGHLGFCMGVPAGFLRFKFGSTWMSVVGFVVSTTGYLLIWSTFLAKYAYHYKVWLMSFYYFVVGHGLVYLYMEALITNMKNLPRRYRGTIVGFLDAVFGASGSFFVLIYKLAFAKSFWERHEEEQNLVGFILFLSACCALVGMLSVVGLREYRHSNTTVPSISHIVSIPDVREYTAPAYEYPRNDSESSSIMADEDDDFIPIVGTRPRLRVIASDSIGTQQRPLTPDSDTTDGRASVRMELLKSGKFHCLIWPFVLTSGVCLVVTTNIEFILKSLGLGDYALTAIVLMAGFNGITRIVCGLVSDKCVDSVPRANVCCFALTPLLVTSAFVVFYTQDPFVLLVWSAALGVAYGSMWCLVPTIISESYGMKYFGLNWGCVLFASALFSFGLQRLFGYFYDTHVATGQLVCYGVDCFRLSFITFLCLILISMFFIATLAKLTQSNENHPGVD